MPMAVGPMSVAFAGGAAAFVHCAGMCGGLSAALASSGSRKLLRHASWQAGRTFSYTFLGGLAGFSGWFVAGGERFRTGQAALSYVAGLLMIAIALTELFPKGGRGDTSRISGLMAPLVSGFLATPTAASSFFVGIATGFLPCPVIWGFAALAGSTGSVAAGMSTMAALAAGTAAPLAVAAFTGGLVPAGLRRTGRIAAALILLVAGIITFLRPMPFLHGLFGCRPAAPGCCTGGALR